MRPTSLLKVIYSTTLLCNLIPLDIKCSSQQHIANDNHLAPNWSPKNRLLVIAAVEPFTSENTIRFNNSLEAFGLESEFLQLKADPSEELESYERERFDQFRQAVARHKGESDLIIMLVDAADSIVNGDSVAILQRFGWLTSGCEGAARVLFSSAAICWPEELSERYAQLANSSHLAAGGYLSSRALIGPASSVDQLLETIASNWQPIGPTTTKGPSARLRPSSFQEEASRLYLNAIMRHRLGLMLDARSELFQSLHPFKARAEDEVELAYELADLVQVRNLAHDSRPVVVHAGGSGRVSVGPNIGRRSASRVGPQEFAPDRRAKASCLARRTTITLTVIFSLSLSLSPSRVSTCPARQRHVKTAGANARLRRAKKRRPHKKRARSVRLRSTRSATTWAGPGRRAPVVAIAIPAKFLSKACG